jgi:hypothetical protein
MKSFMMPKIVKLSKNITPFAGISYVNAEFNRCGLGQLVDDELGARRKEAKYSYSEIFRTWFNVFLCGGQCAEDVKVHLRPTLEQIPDNSVPSPDTLLLGVKELATDNTEVVSTGDKVYQFNINDKMNDLMIKSLLLTNQLEAGKSYDFDYDNQIIAHEKYDATFTYKKNKGYFPGIGSIGDKPVYIENRDGNANVKTDQAETLKRAYGALARNGLSINRSRFDAGSYSKDVVDVVSKNSRLFYIRANKSVSLAERIRQIDNWQTVEIGYKEYRVASLPFTAFFEDRNYRLVIMREDGGDQPADLFTGDNGKYRSILTNDWESTEQEVIEYYNARGASEKIFDIQNNDFGWGHLPCSDMNDNTVYLVITAMIKNFYSYILQKVSKVFTDILPTSRLKRFIFRFINVPGQWIYRGRRWLLNLYTDRPYEKVFV